MRILGLTLEDFRNIERLELRPGPDANVIHGDNAQGKTNILEAVWLFSGARSFRGSKDSELIRFGREFGTLRLAFEAGGREQEAFLAFGEGRKAARLNDIKLPGASRLAGEFCVVLFSPDHLLLVKQGPEHRRRMIDTSLCQAYPKYARILDSYQKILKQRASLLRDIPRNAALLDLLEAWDKSLVEYGAYITAVRSGYVKRLAHHAAEIYRGISESREELLAEYKSTAGPVRDLSRQQVAELLAQAVKASRRDDIAQGKTTVGPHRDDLELRINGASARSYGSQGQQRSTVLALKLAECAILEERNGEPPVVLLDDVMSELDGHRRSYLLNKLREKQVIMTCCDAGLFAGLENGRVFQVRGGALV